MPRRLVQARRPTRVQAHEPRVLMLQHYRRGLRVLARARYRLSGDAAVAASVAAAAAACARTASPSRSTRTIPVACKKVMERRLVASIFTPRGHASLRTVRRVIRNICCAEAYVVSPAR